jgi:hypothetical protein
VESTLNFLNRHEFKSGSLEEGTWLGGGEEKKIVMEVNMFKVYYTYVLKKQNKTHWKL